MSFAGVASSSNTATAVSTKGAATADSGQDEVTGIVLDREDWYNAHPDIHVGGDANITATASTNSSATAATTEGAAAAT